MPTLQEENFRLTLFNAEALKEYETFLMPRDPDYYDQFDEFEDQMRRGLGVTDEETDVDV